MKKSKIIIPVRFKNKNSVKFYSKKIPIISKYSIFLTFFLSLTMLFLSLLVYDISFTIARFLFLFGIFLICASVFDFIIWYNTAEKDIPIYYFKLVNLEKSIQIEYQKIDDLFNTIKSNGNHKDKDGLISQQLCEEWRLDSKYGLKNEPSKDERDKIKSVNADMLDFSEFESNVFNFDLKPFKPYKLTGKLLDRIMLENDISQRYLFFLKLHSLLLKNNFVGRIKYLEVNHKNINTAEYYSMVKELQEDIFNEITEWLTQIDENNAHYNQPFYYENFVKNKYKKAKN